MQDKRRKLRSMRAGSGGHTAPAKRNKKPRATLATVAPESSSLLAEQRLIVAKKLGG